MTRHFVRSRIGRAMPGCVLAAAMYACSTAGGGGTSGSLVRLDAPEIERRTPEIEVHDGREDTSIRLGVPGAPEGSGLVLEVEPPVHTALERIIYAELPPITVPLPFSKVDVKIKSLSLTRRGGFDDLACTMHSTVVLRRGQAKSPMKSVTTDAINRSNKSARPAAAGKAILQQCLHQHAIELIQSVGGR